MNELCVFLFGALFGGMIAAVIAVFYGMYCKEKINAAIQAVRSDQDFKDRKHRLDQGITRRSQNPANLRTGGDDF